MNRDNAGEHPRSTLFVQPPASVPYALFPPGALLSLGTAPAGQWSTGLFDCSADPSNSCVNAGVLFCFLGPFICSFFYSSTYRSKLRGLYSLPEQPCADLLVHWCCPLCAVCQEYRELKNRGLEPSIGWIANVERLMSQDRTMAPPVVAPSMTR